MNRYDKKVLEEIIPQLRIHINQRLANKKEDANIQADKAYTATVEYMNTLKTAGVIKEYGFIEIDVNKNEGKVIVTPSYYPHEVTIKEVIK